MSSLLLAQYTAVARDCRKRGGGLVHLVEGRTRDPKTGGSNPACVMSTRKISESFFRVKNVVLTRCRCAPPPRVYTRTHKNDHVRTLRDPVVHVRVRWNTESRLKRPSMHL